MEGTQNEAGDTIPESCKFYCKDFEKFQILLGSLGTLGAILLLTLLYYPQCIVDEGRYNYIYIYFTSVNFNSPESLLRGLSINGCSTLPNRQ